MADSSVQNSNGLQMGNIPGSTLGSTPPSAFITNNQGDPNNPQLGVTINNSNANSEGTQPGSIIAEKQEIYSEFNNNQEFDFVQGISPNQIGQDQYSTNVPIANPSGQVYLASYVESSDNNEDPVWFGYDIVINTVTSPLFNGAVESFIEQFSAYDEIQARADTITDFQTQFFKFFKISSQSLTNGKDPKTYYLKKLSGIDNLTEHIHSTGEDSKQFIDYKKDKIKLTLYEDVTLNSGYLSFLYKTLSWSKLRGKQLIPENLLRFDATITVTEVRNYNRYIKNSSNQIQVYPDMISKYTYNLYECQFFFPDLSHKSDINMWDKDLTDDMEIYFDYKYTTSRFEIFNPDYYVLDNSQADPYTITSNNTNNATITGDLISFGTPTTYQNPYMQYPEQSANQQQNATNNQLTSGQINQNPNSVLDQLNMNSSSNPASPFSVLAQSVENIGVTIINNQISIQAQLLTNTLNNIASSLGIPTTNLGNVYNSELSNIVGAFVGQSLKCMF